MGKVPDRAQGVHEDSEVFDSVASLNWKKSAYSWTVTCDVDGGLER